jgi:hypothetical protein
MLPALVKPTETLRVGSPRVVGREAGSTPVPGASEVSSCAAADPEIEIVKRTRIDDTARDIRHADPDEESSRYARASRDSWLIHDAFALL